MLRICHCYTENSYRGTGRHHHKSNVRVSDSNLILFLIKLSHFSVHISPELDARIKQFAKENNVTKSKVLHDALEHYLGCMEEKSYATYFYMLPKYMKKNFYYG
ncbi:MAG: ribbon-helix-helix protein, CopG family [Gloeotrichia echinulata GP01]